MTDKIVSFKNFVNSKESNNNDVYHDMVFEQNDTMENAIDIYQVEGITGTNTSIIKKVGIAQDRTIILLKELKFHDKTLKIVSYGLTQSDIIEGLKNGHIKMVSMLIENNKQKIIGAVSIEFYIDNKYCFDDVINNKKLKGKFHVFLRRHENEQLIKLHTFDTFFGNNNVVEKLIKFLNDDELLYIYLT